MMGERRQLPPPPPPIESTLTLSEKTKIYWEIMLLRRGRWPKGGTLSIEQAFYALRLIRDNTDPNRPLTIRAAELRHEIIMFGGSSKRKPKSRKARKRARLKDD